jgi:CRP/FNR family cyclic AMP-dependent transcriptional regulator
MAGIETVNFPAGTVIFKEGDKADAVYFLESGTVEVSRNDSGAKIPLAKLSKDAVFGEMALIDKKPRSATAIALEPTSCLKADEAAFNGVIAKADPIVKEIMNRLVASIREKNQNQKANMSPEDIALAATIKQKNDKLKSDIMASQVIQAKINALDPFMVGLFNSLMKVL